MLLCVPAVVICWACVAAFDCMQVLTFSQREQSNVEAGLGRKPNWSRVLRVCVCEYGGGTI